VALTIVATVSVVRNADRNRFCTMVGGVSGVSVAFDFKKQQQELRAFKARAAKRTQSIRNAVERSDRYARSSLGLRRVAVCVNGRCTDGGSASLIESGSMTVPIAGRRRGPLEVSAIIDRRGRPLQLASGTVGVRRSAPNGPGCGTWWHGAGRVEDSRIVDAS
jgi:hypothetical protein